MLETKNTKFKRLAESRTNEIISKIKILSNCANRSTYAYSSEEVNKIFNAIDRYLKETKAKFTFNKRTKFKL